MMLTDREKTEIGNWRQGLKNNTLLRLSIKDDDAGRQMQMFCSELAGHVPEITLKHEKEEDALSWIMIGQNISYHAVPLSNEFMPFLRALSSTSFPSENMSGELRSILSQITTPAALKIYVSPDCPFCPQVVTRCLAIARMNHAINVSVIDGCLFPEQAAKDSIRSVPTLILDDSFRWTGAVDLEELINVIEQRDPVLLGVETIKNIIHEGQAEELAEMMAARGEIFPAFLEVLTDIKWNVRLGAMAVFEYLIEKSQDLCRRINIELCNRFPDQDDRVKGDIIYLLGESGDQSMIPFIKSLINGPFPQEVREAAADALDNFLRRNF